MTSDTPPNESLRSPLMSVSSQPEDMSSIKDKIMDMNDKAVQAFTMDKIELCHSIFKKIEEMLEVHSEHLDRTFMIIILYNLACTT